MVAGWAFGIIFYMQKLVETRTKLKNITTNFGLKYTSKNSAFDNLYIAYWKIVQLYKIVKL